MRDDILDKNRLTALVTAFVSVLTVVTAKNWKKNIPYADTLTKRM